METTLILNAGSSSLKFRLYRGERIALDGVIDRIGGKAILNIVGMPERPCSAVTHREAGLVVLSLLSREPEAIIHRIVHGGTRAAPARITPALLEELRRIAPLAPLHMPAALALVGLFSERTHARQIACFDTMFHRTMPAYARTYAIPQQLAKKHGIEHYGFHGIAHEELAREGAALASVQKGKARIITCQLGNGASVCAIKNGKSIDTSMGFSPLDGLVMGTRSGDVDPAIIEFLCQRERLSVSEVREMLEQRSGLLALGGSSDVRDLLAHERKGSEQAKLALDIFAYRTRKQIGAYIAALGGVDLIVLGGGIPRAPAMRERILTGLEELGIEFNRKFVRMKAPVRIEKGRVRIVVLEADEQAAMLRLARALLRRGK